jgi:hypothetical protein
MSLFGSELQAPRPPPYHDRRSKRPGTQRPSPTAALASRNSPRSDSQRSALFSVSSPLTSVFSTGGTFQLLFHSVVRSLFCNDHVMDVRFAQTHLSDLDEARLAMQLGNVATATVAHA